MTIEEAERQIAEAVNVIAHARKYETESNIFVTGWVLSYEAMTTEGLAAGTAGGGTVVPDDQSPAMSRGMALAAADHFSPYITRPHHDD